MSKLGIRQRSISNSWLTETTFSSRIQRRVSEGGRVWPKAVDLRSAPGGVRGFKSCPSHSPHDCFAGQPESTLAFQASVCHAKSEFSLGDNSRGCRAPRLFWNTGPIWSGPLLFSNRLRGVESLAWLFRMNSLVDEICLGEFGECMPDCSGGE